MEKVDVEKISEDEFKENQKKSNKWPVLLVIKILLFILCLAGFSYQADEFLDYYHTYPTVVELKVERKMNYTIPAVTYCFVNNIIETGYCLKNPSLCKDVNTYQACEDFPEYCAYRAKIPDHKKLQKASINLEDLIDVGSNISNIMIWNPWGFKGEDSMQGPHYYGSWWSLRLFTCYSLNSLVSSQAEPKKQAIDSEDMKEDKYSRNFVGYFYFNWSMVIQSNNQHVEGLTFHIHSPFNSAIPPLNFVLQPGRRYEVVMTLEEETLLPAPYGTECINYTESWQNALRLNETKPRSEKICKELCEVNFDFKCEGCVNIWNLYPHTDKPKCFRGIDHDFLGNCSKEVRNQYDDCVKACRMECKQLKYRYTIKELEKDAWDYRGYHPDYIQIDFYVKPEILVYTHRPQFKDVELFSYIGGYMGIWLGISLFALADIIKSSYAVLTQWLHQAREVKRTGSLKNWRSSILMSGNVK